MSEHPAAKRHRAYAQAVDEAFAERGYLDGHKDGYAAGLTAARDAVAAECSFGQTLPCSECQAALAAIDALLVQLRGERS